MRAAVPGFDGHVHARCAACAGRRATTSSRGSSCARARRYELAHGPFRRADFKALPARDWTLLVQGVNLHSDDADALLRRFAFLPYARLDDVMVSYAAPGGGVGPHFDSYDVFLLQGFGRRRWRYGRQADLTLRAGLPVKILRTLRRRQHDAVLAPGDMLYLPPSYAHDGVAVDACTTYSIGFRAATHTELAQHFLDYLRDRVDLPGRYADPGLRPAREPGAHRRVDATARRHASSRSCAGTARTSARFLGEFLSEPKPNDVLRAAAGAAFAARLRSAARRKRGVRLDRRAQWLYDDDAHVRERGGPRWPRGARRALVALANARALSPRRREAAVQRHNRDFSRRLPRWLPPHRLSTTRAARADARHRRGAVAAIDELVDLAQQRLQVFDIDLAQGGWQSARAPMALRRVPAPQSPGAARSHRARHALARDVVPATRCAAASSTRTRSRSTARAAEARNRDGPADDRRRRGTSCTASTSSIRARRWPSSTRSSRALSSCVSKQIWATGEPGLSASVLGSLTRRAGAVGAALISISRC